MSHERASRPRKQRGPFLHRWIPTTIPAFKNFPWALARWLSWLEHSLVHQKVADSIPGQGTYLGCGFDPWLGHIWEAANQCFSLSQINIQIFQVMIKKPPSKPKLFLAGHAGASLPGFESWLHVFSSCGYLGHFLTYKLGMAELPQRVIGVQQDNPCAVLSIVPGRP